MSERLNGKIAFVTGAASGIGLATVELFIEEGARVLAADVQEDAGRALEKRFSGALRFAPCDVTRPLQIRQAIDSAAEHFGGLDIVFNNAGAAGFVTGTHLTVDGGITIGRRHAWDPGTPGPVAHALDLSAAQWQAMRRA
ncbi:MAG: SDR family NAD(P)-dependent oxidoreductase [Burkholderiaceae bacterium]